MEEGRKEGRKTKRQGDGVTEIEICNLVSCSLLVVIWDLMFRGLVGSRKRLKV